MDPRRGESELTKKLLESEEGEESLLLPEESSLEASSSKQKGKKKGEKELEKEGRVELQESEEGDDEEKKDDEEGNEGYKAPKEQGGQEEGKREEESQGQTQTEPQEEAKELEIQPLRAEVKKEQPAKKQNENENGDEDEDGSEDEDEESHEHEEGESSSSEEGDGGEEEEEEEEEKEEEEEPLAQDLLTGEREEFKMETLELQKGLSVLSYDKGPGSDQVIYSQMRSPFPADLEMQPLIVQPQKEKELGIPKDEQIRSIVEANAVSSLNLLKREVKPIAPKEQDNAAFQKRAAMGREEVTSAIKKRKTMRYIAYIIYLIVIAVLLALAFKLLMIRDYLFSQPNANLAFTIDNCTLLIMDNTDATSSSSVYAKYQVPTQIQPDSPTIVRADTGSDPQTLTVLNGIDPKYCLIHLFIKPNTPLQSLQVNCGRCNITQDTSSPLQVNGILNITGEVIHANFRDLNVGSLNYQSITGYLQLNNIQSSAQAENNIAITSKGDIIIQSTTNFLVTGTTDTQAFCLNAPAVIANGASDCAVSNAANPSQFNPPYPSCQFSYYICTDGTCSGKTMPTFTIVSTSGNIYANIIPTIGSPAANGTITKGEIYNGGISFDPNTNASVSSFDTLAADPSKGNPFILLNLGDYESRSSRYTKWVISSTPSYAYMRPWWIGTFSAGVLDGYVETANGFLLPGFCPYVPEYTTQDLLAVQNLITSSVNTLNTLVTFISDSALPPPPVVPQQNSGIFPLIEKGNPSDYWYSLSRAPNGKIVLDNNNYTKNGAILGAIIVSLLIAVYVAYLALSITFIAVNVMYTKLVDFASHLENYAKIEQPKVQKSDEPTKEAQKKPESVMASRYSLTNIMQHAPSPSAFVDYLTLVLYRQYSSSVVQFYHLLFREVKDNQASDMELDPNRDMIKGSDAKLLYEKLCFMNHLNEQKLTDAPNLAILRKYGFEIVTRNDMQSQVFTKMTIKIFEPFLVNSFKEDQYNNSLDVYIKENVKLTKFEEDQIEVDSFIKLYHEFCDYNRLPKVSISPSMMKEKYDINVNFVPQQLIMRVKTDEDVFLPNYEQTYLQKISLWWRRGSAPQKTYVIDTSKLENHFNLVMNKIENMTQEQLGQATLDLILYPGWQLWDAITVFFHLFIGALITLPLIALAVLNESQYAPWSLKHYIQLIQVADIVHDPAQFVVNLYNSFSWNVVLVVVATILWIISFFDLLLYYAVMEFPQDKSFKKSEDIGEEGLWHKRSRQLEWILVIIALAFYFGYIGLFLTWLLLGALINPSIFLPFASASMTFVTFITTKYNYFKGLAAQGTKAVMVYVNKIFEGFINGVLGKITEAMDNLPTELQEKAKEAAQTGALKEAANKLEEAGIVDSTTATTASVAGFAAVSAAGSAAGAPGDTAIVIKDPSVFTREVQSKADALKQKTIAKIRENCEKRGIPLKVVDLMIAVYIKTGNDNIKALLKDVIQELNAGLKLPQEGADIIIELLFPTGVNKEETVMFVTNKIISLIFKIGDFNNYKGLSPNILISIFNIFKSIEEENYETFMKDLKGLLTQLKSPMTEAQLFLPALDTISILAKEKPDDWNVKDPCFQLLNAAALLVEDKEQAKAVKSFTKIVPHLFVAHEVPYDLDTKKNLIPQEAIKLITQFCGSIGIDKKLAPNVIKNEKFIPFLAYLASAYIRQDTHDLPKDVIRTLEKLFEAEIPSTSKFLDFCINLSSVVYNDPQKFYKHLNKGIEHYRFSTDLQNFLKIMSCYSLDTFEVDYSTISLEKNAYILRIAHILKTNPKELIGFLDLLYNKSNSDHVKVFLKAILSRMNINQDRVGIIRSIMQLFLSDDESLLLRAINDLNLDHSQFLLVGKALFNPRFIPTSQFRAVGITDPNLLKQRETIFSGSYEAYSSWLSELRKNITDNLNYIKILVGDADRQDQNLPATANVQNPPALMSYEEFKKFEYQANMVKFFLSDFESFTYSKKNISSALTALDNPENQIRKKLIDYGPGASFNGVDFLVAVMGIDKLRVANGKRYTQFKKEDEAVVNVLADYLSVDAEAMKNFVQLFVLNTQKDVLKSFYYFFPDDKENEETIKKALSFSFRKTAAAIKQQNTASSASNFFELFDGPNNSQLPDSLLIKILDDNQKREFTASDLVEFAHLLIKTLGLSPDEREALYMECYAFALFAKGMIPKDSVANLLQIQDRSVLALLHMMLEPDMNTRYASLSGLFLEKAHPMKVGLAISSLLTSQNFNVRHNPSLILLKEVTQGEESIRSYLGDLLGVYPEAFDMFEIIFERDPTTFLKKALPLIRRLTNSSIVNVNLLESLFLLMLAEHFNPSALASKLEISGDIIEFIVTLMRLSNKPTRKKELKELSNSIPLNKILSRLRIKPNEFVSLAKLTLNAFDTEDSVVDILTNLNLVNPDLKGAEAKDQVNVDLFKGLITLNKPNDLKLDIFKSKTALTTLKAKLTSLFNYLNLGKDQDIAFLISRISTGNFLVIEQFKEYFTWAYPTHDPKAERAILGLTMAITGLINPNVEQDPDFDAQTQAFVDRYYPKFEFTFQEPAYIGTKNLPNNSLAYATYLAYESVDLPPKWTQAFFLDRQTFRAITKRIPDIKEEFLLALVLTFRELPDIMGDMMGLFDWTFHCLNFYKQHTGKQPKESAPISKFKLEVEKFYEYFQSKMPFEYQPIKDKADGCGLLQVPYWSKFFADADVYNYKVNQSLLYLFTLKMGSEDKQSIFAKVKGNMRMGPSDFMNQLSNEIPRDLLFSELEETQAISGKMLREALVRCYEHVTEKFYRRVRLSGFAITDFCMLGTIIRLKSQSNYSIGRKIYNLHQLGMNMERKLYFDDYFFKMSKFKVVKLASLSLGCSFCNLAELSSFQTSFREEYISDLELAETEEERIQVKIKQCEEFVFKGEIKEKKPKPKEEEKKEGENDDEKDQGEVGEGESNGENEEDDENDDAGNYICDFAFYGGTYMDFVRFAEDIFKLEDWESTKMLFEYDSSYPANPQADNAANLINYYESWVQARIKASDGKNYLPFEFARSIYDDNGVRRCFSLKRLKYRNPDYAPDEKIILKEGVEEKKEENKEEQVNEEEKTEAKKPEGETVEGQDEAPQGEEEDEKGEDEEDDEEVVETEEEKAIREKMEENLIDIKTGLSFKSLRNKLEEFERVSMDPNLELIQGVIRGDVSQLTEGENVISQNDPEKNLAKIYKALLGLQSYIKQTKKDRFSFRDCLTILSTKIESDVSKLDELLNFFITRKPILTETVNALEISENIVDFLLMNVKQKGTGDDEEEGENTFSVAEAISKVLNISTSEAKIYQTIRDLYQVQNKAWLEVVDALIIKKDAFKPGQHPLTKLLDMINFTKFKKQVNAGEDRKIIHSLKTEFKHDIDYIQYLFANWVMQIDIYPEKLTYQMKINLRVLNNVVYMLLEQNYAQLFEVILERSDSENVIDAINFSRQDILENLVSMFGANILAASTKKDIDLLRLFFALSHGNLIAFKNNEKYETLIGYIITDMGQLQILNSIKNQPESLRLVNQFLLGVLSWDLELSIKALIQAGAVNEGYLLYNLYGCLNFDKLYALGGKYRKQAESHLLALLPHIFSSTLSKSAAKYYGIEDIAGEAQQNMEEYLTAEPEGSQNYSADLLVKVAELFKTVQRAKESKSKKGLIDHMIKAFNRNSSKELTTGTQFTTFEDILVSVFNGSFFHRIINTFCYEDYVKNLVKSWIKLMLYIYKFHEKNKGDKKVIECFNEFVEAVKVVAKTEIWDQVLKIAPDVVKIVTLYEKDTSSDPNELKKEAFSTLKGLASLIKDKDQEAFVLDLMSVMLGVNMRNYDKEKIQGRIRSDLSMENRIELFFNQIGSIFFPTKEEKELFQKDKELFQTWPREIYSLIAILRTDFMQGMKDPQKLDTAVRDILTVLQKFKVVSKPHIEALMNMLNAELEDCDKVILVQVPHTPRSILRHMVNYLQESLSLLKLDFTAKSKGAGGAAALPAQTKQAVAVSTLDPEERASIMRKIKEGKATAPDLFKMIDDEGDKSGSISEQEFQILASRLGLKLSSHRIKEIFAKVKGKKAKAGGNQELNQEEFAKALEYLQEKNLTQALQTLGITPEILTAILIRLVILLLLVFVFIFLGMKAFAIGGTFGSIINSALPAAGGGALGKESDSDKGKLEEDNVKDATDKGFEITNSDAL